MTRLSAFILILLVAGVCQAETISGQVIAVADGDTLTILDSQKSQIKVRLAAIDAPERIQAFGNRSRQSLSDICFGKDASVDVVDTDRYGRTVGVVTCDAIRANDAQVQAGMAWVYRKYAAKFTHLIALEEAARSAELGLWADQVPVPPWEWRKGNR